MSDVEDRCRRCRIRLVTSEEIDCGLCEDHIDCAIDDYLEAREWRASHCEDW